MKFKLRYMIHVRVCLIINSFMSKIFFTGVEKIETQKKVFFKPLERFCSQNSKPTNLFFFGWEEKEREKTENIHSYFIQDLYSSTPIRYAIIFLFVGTFIYNKKIKNDLKEKYCNFWIKVQIFFLIDFPNEWIFILSFEHDFIISSTWAEQIFWAWNGYLISWLYPSQLVI